MDEAAAWPERIDSGLCGSAIPNARQTGLARRRNPAGLLARARIIRETGSNDKKRIESRPLTRAIVDLMMR
jgi:hypothetical protein